jgi:hypothetical protein
VPGGRRSGWFVVQFMSIFSWEPGRTGEIMEMRAVGKTPDGMIVINEWIDPGSSTVFRLVAVEDPAALLKAGSIGIHPAMEEMGALKHPGR